MTLEKINQELSLLRPGALVTIEITTPAGQRAKARTCYVGFLPKHYILVQMPDSSKFGNNSQYIKTGMACTFRGLIEGEQGAVIAFVANIERTVKLPSRLMVLTFPNEIAVQPLRKNTRISTALTGKMQIGKKVYQGEVRDLSVSGCLFSVGNAMDLLVSDNQDVVIVIEDDIFETAYRFKGAICSTRQRADMASIGIRFNGNTEEKVVRVLGKLLLNEAH